MKDDKIASLVNRLESYKSRSSVELLIKESIDTIIEQQKHIADLESIVNKIDGALCNYLNGCDDPYEPVSKWDEESKHNFEKLCESYQEWHSSNKEIGKISMNAFLEMRTEMQQSIIRSLKTTLYSSTHNNKDAQEIIERVIRHYQDGGYSIL